MTTCIGKAWVGYFLSDDQAIYESFMFFNLPLLEVKLVLHLLELLGQEVVLLSDLLPGHCEYLVLFLGFNEVSSDYAELVFARFDFIHVVTGLEPAFLHQLKEK